MKIKNFCAPRTLSRKLKDLQNGRKYLQIVYLTRDCYPKCIKNSYNSTWKKKKIKKWTQDLNRYFSKEDTQMTNKYMKRCSTPLIIREMQIKTGMKHYFMPIEVVIIFFKKENNKCWRGCEEIGILVHCWYTEILAKLLRKIIWQLFKEIKHLITT